MEPLATTPGPEATVAIDGGRIVATPGIRGGKPRLRGHRITVADVAVWYERMGMTPDEIVESYPTIGLADVHAALAYYYEHREAIDAAIREGEAAVESLRAGRPSLLDTIRRRSLDAPDDSLPPR